MTTILGPKVYIEGVVAGGYACDKFFGAAGFALNCNFWRLKFQLKMIFLVPPPLKIGPRNFIKAW